MRQNEEEMTAIEREQERVLAQKEEQWARELREWRKTIHQAATQDSPSAAAAAHSRTGGWVGGGSHGKMMRMYGRDVPHPYDMRQHEFPAEILKSQCPSLISIL